MSGVILSYELFCNTKVPIKIPVYTYSPKNPDVKVEKKDQSTQTEINESEDSG